MFRKVFINILIFLPSLSLAVAEIYSPVTAEVNGIAELLQIIINGVTYIAVPIIVLAFIYSGFLFVSAQGDANKLSEAKKAFLWTVIGAAIILGANVILDVVTTTTKSFISA